MSDLELKVISSLYKNLSDNELKDQYEKIINNEVNISEEDRYSLLIEAIKYGLYKFTKLLLSSDKININQEKNGLTAIIASLFYMRDREHQKEIFNLLIKSGASLDIFKGGSITPLVYAIQSSDIDIVKLLLKYEKRHKYNNHFTRNVVTPLMIALTENKLDVVKLLLRRFNNPGIYHKDTEGNCALLYACKYGNLESVKLLLRKKNINTKNRNNETPLILSLKYNNRDIVKFLLRKSGTDINIIDNFNYNAFNICCMKGYVEELNLLINKGVDINYINNNGYNGFTFACKYGKLDIVKVLVEHKVKTNYLCDENKTGFMLACKNGYTDIVKFLLNVDISLMDEINNDNLTPLILACLENQIDVVKLLIDNDVDINTKDKYNLTALVYAFKSNNIDIIELLLENGADINTINYDCIEYCIKNGYEKIIELLLERGYSNIIYDKLFLLCTKYNLYNLCKFIISNYNIDLNYFEYDNMKLFLNNRCININCEHTPLIVACMNDNLDIVMLLLDNNVDVNFRVSGGNTVFTLYCKKMGYFLLINSEIMRLLLSRTDISICDDYSRNVLINICDSRLVVIDKLELLNSLKDQVDIHLLDNFGNSGLDYIKDKFFNMISNDNYFRSVDYKYYESYIKIIFLLKKTEEEFDNILLKVIDRCCTSGLKDIAKRIISDFISDTKTLLIKSCKNNHKRLVKELIESGYDLNYKEDDKSCLDILLSNNNTSLIELFLKNGGYISYKKLKEYKSIVYDSNLDLLRVLKKHELFLRDIKTNNLRKLLCMKKVDNTTFGGDLLINDYDIKRYVGSFL